MKIIITKGLLVFALIITAMLASPISSADSGTNFKADVQSLLGTLKLVGAEYVDAVKDGKIIDEKEYLETEIFIDKAIEQYTGLAEEIGQASPELKVGILTQLNAIKQIVQSKGDPASVGEQLKEITASLQKLSGGGVVSDQAKGEARGQSLADTRLGGEQLIGGLRMGLIIEPAKNFWFYDNEKLIENSAAGLLAQAGQTHYFKAVLREKTTKRMIPYTEISINITGTDGWSSSAKLYPVWGEFFHYGNNLSLPGDGNYQAAVSIEHGPMAHEELDKWIKPIVAIFDLTVKGNTAEVIEQPKITAADDGFAPGDDIDIAVAELWEEKRVGQYSIGFIAENVEEIYAFQSGTLSGTKRPTDNYHLEVVLREASSGRIVPYATLTMRLTNQKTGQQVNYNLVPMWATFLHYATNAEVVPGAWNVEVEIAAPALAYEKQANALGEAATEFTFDTDKVSKAEETNELTGGIAKIKDTVDQAVREYKAGNYEAASKLARDAFIIFEEEIGSKISAKNAPLEDEIENQILKLSSMMKGPSLEVDNLAATLDDNLDRAEALLQKPTSVAALFIQSLAIITREGFEAIIILAAIIAYLLVTENKEKVKIIYQAAGLAILASLLTAWLIERVFKAGFASQEILEGATMLVAVAVLLYVWYWLINKIPAYKWQKFIHGKVKNAVTSGNQFILGSVAFLAVYREGFETVLFYKALFISAPAGGYPIFFGLISGALILAITFWLFKKFGVKIPIKQFFIATSAIMFYMAFTFLGNGLAELQEGQALSTNFLSWAPRIPFLGMYSTVETFVAQMILLIVLSFSLLYLFFWRREKDTQE
ncbi:MAG: iron transporter [bacterium]|nr:iron transporter [bacterium]